MALAKDDDLHAGQHHLLHRHLGAAERGGPPTGEAVSLGASVHPQQPRRWLTSFFFAQGGILNRTRKRSEQVQRDPDREPLREGEEEPLIEEDEGFRSRSVNN